MQLIDFEMIKNQKKIAELRLERHREAGNRSQLSIFEVANLMDILHRAEVQSHFNNKPNIFHSMAFN